MTDQELLERAARAAGIDLCEPGWCEWNPLTDDGDALRLAVTVNADISIKDGHTWADIRNGLALVKVPHGNDPCAATRRAIVTAVAALGK